MKRVEYMPVFNIKQYWAVTNIAWKLDAIYVVYYIIVAYIAYKISDKK